LTTLFEKQTPNKKE